MLSLCDGQFNTKSCFSAVYYIELGTMYDNVYFVTFCQCALNNFVLLAKSNVQNSTLSSCVQFTVFLYKCTEYVK